jgi:membrane-anchored protein YejM (alkaline phosphatase superfamily)
MKTLPQKKIGGNIIAIASLYLGVVTFLNIRVYIWTSGCSYRALKSQRARASLSWPLSKSLPNYAFANDVTARS